MEVHFLKCNVTWELSERFCLKVSGCYETKPHIYHEVMYIQSLFVGKEHQGTEWSSCRNVATANSVAFWGTVFLSHWGLFLVSECKVGISLVWPFVLSFLAGCFHMENTWLVGKEREKRKWGKGNWGWCWLKSLGRWITTWCLWLTTLTVRD